MTSNKPPELRPDYYRVKVEARLLTEPAGANDRVRVELECFDLIDALGAGFYLGSALKYAFRAGKKVGAAKQKDMLKAVTFMQQALERECEGMTEIFLGEEAVRSQSALLAAAVRSQSALLAADQAEPKKRCSAIGCDSTYVKVWREGVYHCPAHEPGRLPGCQHWSVDDTGRCLDCKWGTRYNTCGLTTGCALSEPHPNDQCSVPF